jgi:hypothetical protein
MVKYVEAISHTVEACHAPTIHTFSFTHHFISHGYVVFL